MQSRRSFLPQVIVFFSLLIFSSLFQNCSRVQFSIQQSLIDSNAVESLSGNGGGYSGKPGGIYYHMIPSFTCEEKLSFYASIDLTNLTNIFYTENRSNQCQAIVKKLNQTDLVFSQNQGDVIGFGERIFERKELSPLVTPPKLVEAWCLQPGGNFDLEFIASYNRDLQEAELRKLTRAGSSAVMTDVTSAAIRTLGSKVIKFVSAEGEIEVTKEFPGTQPGTYLGQFRSINSQSTAKLDCRLGGLLDSSLWPAKTIIDSNVTEIKFSSDEQQVYTSVSVPSSSGIFGVLSKIDLKTMAVQTFSSFGIMPNLTLSNLSWDPTKSNLFFKGLHNPTVQQPLFSLNTLSGQINTISGDTWAIRPSAVKGGYTITTDGKYCLYISRELVNIAGTNFNTESLMLANFSATGTCLNPVRLNSNDTVLTFLYSPLSQSILWIENLSTPKVYFMSLNNRMKVPVVLSSIESTQAVFSNFYKSPLTLSPNLSESSNLINDRSKNLGANSPWFLITIEDQKVTSKNKSLLAISTTDASELKTDFSFDVTSRSPDALWIISSESRSSNIMTWLMLNTVTLEKRTIEKRNDRNYEWIFDESMLLTNDLSHRPTVIDLSSGQTFSICKDAQGAFNPNYSTKQTSADELAIVFSQSNVRSIWIWNRTSQACKKVNQFLSENLNSISILDYSKSSGDFLIKTSPGVGYPGALILVPSRGKVPVRIDTPANGDLLVSDGKIAKEGSTVLFRENSPTGELKLKLWKVPAQ